MNKKLWCLFPDWLVIVDSYLFFQCFWCHFSVSIVQLAVFCCVDLVEVEREALTIRQAGMEAFFPVFEAKSLKNVLNKSIVLLQVVSNREGHLLAYSICTVAFGRMNGEGKKEWQQWKATDIIHGEIQRNWFNGNIQKTIMTDAETTKQQFFWSRYKCTYF